MKYFEEIEIVPSFQVAMEENPFPDLKVSESGWLDEIPGRSACPRCNKSRKWYCYTCNVPIAALVDKIPRVKVTNGWKEICFAMLGRVQNKILLRIFSVWFSVSVTAETRHHQTSE